MEDSKRKEKASYLVRKKKMVEYEKNNYSTIVFFAGTNGFYVAGGHSAIILYNLIAPELGLKIAVSKDRDFELRFEGGILSIKNLEKYKALLADSSYIDGFSETKYRLAFKLKKPLTVEEYRVLANAENIKREELVNLISSTKVMPRTYQALRELVKVCYKASEKRSDAVARELLTFRVVGQARAALINILSGCKQTKGFSLAMDKVDDCLKSVITELVVIEAAGVWSISQCRKISFAAVRARESLAVERREYE